MLVTQSDLIPLREAAKLIPPKRGKKVHISTLIRWGRKGKITIFEYNGLKVSRTEILARFTPRPAYSPSIRLYRPDPTPSPFLPFPKRHGRSERS
jgi:hypothetical protein